MFLTVSGSETIVTELQLRNVHGSTTVPSLAYTFFTVLLLMTSFEVTDELSFTVPSSFPEFSGFISF